MHTRMHTRIHAHTHAHTRTHTHYTLSKCVTLHLNLLHVFEILCLLKVMKKTVAIRIKHDREYSQKLLNLAADSVKMEAPSYHSAVYEVRHT